MPININNIINTFESFGDAVVQSQALQAELRKQGFDINEIVTEINKAIESGVLNINATSGIKKA